MFFPNPDGPRLPSGFETYRPARPADVGMEDYIYRTRLSFIPESYVGTGIQSRMSLGVNTNGVLAINKTVNSGLPGIIVPSFRTQPLTAQNPAA